MTNPTTPDSSTRSNRLRLLVFTGVILLVMVGLALFVDWQEVWLLLLGANKLLLGAASAVFLFGLAAYAVRWRLLLGRRVPLPTVFHASNIGLAANLALPLRAGEPIRIYAIGRDPNNPVSYAEATSSVVAEKMFEQIMRLVTFGLALLVGVEQSRGTLIGIVATLAVGFTALWWTLTHQERVLRVGTVWLAKLPRITEPQARQAIGDVLANLSAVTSPRLLAGILSWSVVTWGLFGLFFYLVIAALGDALPRDQWLQVALGAMALSPPTAPTQPGLFHGSVIVPLTALGFGVTGLTAFAIVAHMLEMVLLLVMAGIGMVRMGISAESLLSASQQAPSSD